MEMNNNNNNDAGGVSGYESPFKTPDLEYKGDDTAKLEEELTKRDEAIQGNFDQAIGAPTSNYEEFNDLFIKAASLPEEAKSIADYVASKGPLFKAFFDRYVSNYSLCSPSKEVTDEVNKILQNGDNINSYKYGDKNICMREVTLKDELAPGVQASNSLILAKFISKLGGGNTVNIPLWHSGFRVILNPPSVAELTTLHMQVVKSEVDLGRETMSLISAANRSTSISIIKDFIKDKIFKTTLDVDLNTTDIFQYISILDFDFLLLGMLAGTYVNKISSVRTCVNTFRESDGSGLGCGHSVTADLDPYKLTVVDRSLLTANMVRTISKSVANSVTLEERVNYVNELDKQLNEKRGRSESFVSNDAVYNFKVPSVNLFIQDGANWVEEAMNDVYSLGADLSYRQKEILAERIKDVRGATIMSANVHSIGFKDVNTPEGAYLSDRGSIYLGLKAITNNVTAINDFFVAVNSYVNKSYLAICATPNYICPKCKKLQDVKRPEDFDAFIPLNILDFFLTLVEVIITNVQINTKVTS